MQRKSKSLSILLPVCLVFLLSGCQLAKEEMVGAGKDRLIGVYITTEHVDLFDMEEYIEEHPNMLLQGETVQIGKADSLEYANRLYAVKEKETLHYEDGTAGEEMDRYVFKETEGFGCFAPMMEDPKTGSSYLSLESDEEISDAKSLVNSRDDEEKVELSGTIYICPSKGKNVTIYCNPVYQSQDGRVYLLAGNGMSFEAPGSEGVVMSTEISETVTLTEEGETRNYSTAVKVSAEIVFMPEKIRILQMDGQGNVIDKQEYVPGEMPDELIPLDGTEYLIVETCKKAMGDSENIKRELIDKQIDGFRTLNRKENGICVQKWTHVWWAE